MIRRRTAVDATFHRYPRHTRHHGCRRNGVVTGSGGRNLPPRPLAPSPARVRAQLFVLLPQADTDAKLTPLPSPNCENPHSATASHHAAMRCAHQYRFTHSRQTIKSPVLRPVSHHNGLRCARHYRLTHCGAFLAFLRPLFLRSTTRGSRFIIPSANTQNTHTHETLDQPSAETKRKAAGGGRGGRGGVLFLSARHERRSLVRDVIGLRCCAG